MEARVEKLEIGMELISETLKMMQESSSKAIDHYIRLFYLFNNTLVALQNKGVLDKDDLSSIRDIQKQIEQITEKTRHDLLFQLAGEEGTPPQ